MRRYDSDQRQYHDTEPPAIDLEKRLMLSFALLGSFAFGFIFFGDAPTILSLLLFFGPTDGLNLLPKVLGIAGLLLIGASIYWREGNLWRPAMIVGASALFSSWLLYFSIVGGNLMTLLGTAPFLFFSLWFLSDTVRSTISVVRLRERYLEVAPELQPVRSRARLAGFFEGLAALIRRWLRVEEDLHRNGGPGSSPTPL